MAVLPPGCSSTVSGSIADRAPSRTGHRRNLKQIINQIHWKVPGSLGDFAWHQDSRSRRPALGLSQPRVDPTCRRASPSIRTCRSRVACASSRAAMFAATSAWTARKVLGAAMRDAALDAVGLSTSDAVDLILEPGDLALWSPYLVHGSGTNQSATSADSTSTAMCGRPTATGANGRSARAARCRSAAGPSSSITRNCTSVRGRTTSKRQLMSAMGGKRTLVDAPSASPMDKLECYGLSRKSPPTSLSGSLRARNSRMECSNPCTMRLESEMSGVEHVDLRVGIVAKVSLAAGSDEDLIPCAPHHERRRPVAAEIVLPLGIEGKVGSVIVEQVELDVGVARSVHQRLVMRPGVWAKHSRVVDAVLVLPEVALIVVNQRSASRSAAAPVFQ